MTSFEERLKPILPGGWNGLQLWPSINLIMISWMIFIFLPRWKWTPSVTLIIPILICMMYTSGMIFYISDTTNQDTDLFTFEGIVNAFQNPNLVFIGWIHYLAFDCLVGRMILLDSIRLTMTTTTLTTIGFHILVVIPSLFFTLMLGPIGFLLYMTARIILWNPSYSIGESMGIIHDPTMVPEKAKIF